MPQTSALTDESLLVSKKVVDAAYSGGIAKILLDLILFNHATMRAPKATAFPLALALFPTTGARARAD